MVYIYERQNDTTPEFTGYMIDESSLYGDSFDYHSISRSKEFLECCNYFNNDDEKTRKVLLAVNEADQGVVAQALASKLYTHIIDKVDDIDYGTIPLSKGDIEKIDHYEQLVDCINVLSQVLQNYHQDTKPVDVVNVALNNMIDRKEIFKQAYKYNVELPIITYNTMVLSIVGATSLLISSHIEFIKMNDNTGYDIAFDRASKGKTSNKLLFNTLERFNVICSNGEFDKSMDYAIKNNIKLKAESYYYNEGIADFAIAKDLGAIGGLAKTFATSHPIITAIVATITVIKLLRVFIFYFYYARTKVSMYFDSQSALLYMNAMNIENSLTKDDKEKQKTIAKQRKIADLFSRLSNTLKVKDRTSEAKTESDIKKLDNEKLNINDVMDNIPDSANAVLF